MPTHVETLLNYLHFERRQDPSVFESMINNYIHSDQLSALAKAFFTVQYIKYLQKVSNLFSAVLCTEKLIFF